MAEAYNETHRGSLKVELFKQFLVENSKIGRHFQRKPNNEDIIDDDVYDPTEEETSNDNHARNTMYELHRKNVSKALYNQWILEELKDRKKVGKILFGPKHDEDENLKTYQITVDEFLDNVDEWRTNELYEHEECTGSCKKRGCGSVWSMDGLWKLAYPICMADVQGGVSEDLHQYIPNVCTESPAFGQAFCQRHCNIIGSMGYPTELREFLKSCSGDGHEEVNPDNFTKIMQDRVARVLKKISTDIPDSTKFKSSVDAQGTGYLLRDRNIITKATVQMTGDGEDCNKDTGTKVRLRRWSRGVFAIVRGGGHIEYFSPLYKSESPTQVATITLKFLLEALKHIEVESWSKVFLSYDNMCNLDRIKLLKQKLPLDGEESDIWLKINKVIDPLHLKNHKRVECHQMYNPDILATSYPEANLMVCEQVFSWLGRYKKIVNSMPKSHHHFFLHKLIKRRNAYTSYCQRIGKYPLLPSARIQK